MDNDHSNDVHQVYDIDDLVEYAKSGNVIAVQFVMEQLLADDYYHQTVLETSLFESIMHGQNDCTVLLIDGRTNLYLSDEYDHTILNYAAINNNLF